MARIIRSVDQLNKDLDTEIANIALKAPLASPALTGTPTVNGHDLSRYENTLIYENTTGKTSHTFTEDGIYLLEMYPSTATGAGTTMLFSQVYSKLSVANSAAITDETQLLYCETIADSHALVCKYYISNVYQNDAYIKKIVRLGDN